VSETTAETPTEAPETAEQPGAGTEVPPEAENVSETPSDASEDTTETDAPDDVEPSGKGKAAREAAKYRTQLRETEGKLAEALQTIDNMRSEIVSDLAESAGLVRGSELTVPVSELLDDTTGLVDADKVRVAVAALVTSKPYLKREFGSPEWLSGRPVSDSQAEAMQAGKSWSDLLSS
jgi:hypothetical protein